MINNKTYLYGLDAFRGVAALFVIFEHIELVKKQWNIPNVYDGGGFFFHY